MNQTEIPNTGQRPILAPLTEDVPTLKARPLSTRPTRATAPEKPPETHIEEISTSKTLLPCTEVFQSAIKHTGKVDDTRFLSAPSDSSQERRVSLDLNLDRHVQGKGFDSKPRLEATEETPEEKIEKLTELKQRLKMDMDRFKESAAGLPDPNLGRTKRPLSSQSRPADGSKGTLGESHQSTLHFPSLESLSGSTLGSRKLGASSGNVSLKASPSQSKAPTKEKKPSALSKESPFDSSSVPNLSAIQRG
jgi:hypothetical protein